MTKTSKAGVAGRWAQWFLRFAGLVLALPVGAADITYKTLDGVSPVPLTDQVGLKSREELEAFIDGVMTAQMRAQKAVGGLVAVVKDGELFFAKGYGYADRERQLPVDPYNTLFRPGSVSKLFTWTALMQLVERGEVELDADVNRYLSQLQIPDTFPGQPVTVRNLMTHSAGFEDGSVGFLIVDSAERLLGPVEALKAYQPQRVRAPATGDFSNGDMASYSNWGTELAGLIIANVSGMSFNEYIEQHIFQPLGMADSSFRQPVPEHLADRLALGYKIKAGRLQAQPFEYVMFPAAGSLSATAEDIAKFMIAHAQGGAYGDARILGEAAARQMHARSLSPSPYVNGAALGFYENYVNGRRILVHAGNTTQFQTEFNLLIDQGVGLFFSVNSESTLAFSARKELLHAFMDRYYPATLPRLQPPEDFAQRAGEYVGSYRFNRHAYSTTEKAFSLLSTGISVSASDRGTLLVSGLGTPLPSEWTEVAKDTFRMLDDDAMIAFSRDEAGEVVTLLNVGALPSMQAYRIPLDENPQLHWLLQALALIGFVAAMLGVFRHWKADRQWPLLARGAQFSAGFLGLTQLVFVVLFALSVISLTNHPLGPYPASMVWALDLSWLNLVLTVIVALLALLSWQQGWWGRGRRIGYSLIALLSLGFMWSLHTWNLIGNKLP